MSSNKLSFSSPGGKPFLVIEDNKAASFSSCKFQIFSLSLFANLYQPNQLLVVLSVSKEQNSYPSSDELNGLSNAFASSIVSFSLFGLKEFSNHRVFHFSSHSSFNENGAVSACSIHLDIRSRDFALSRDAFSKTYVGSKLGAHIISDALNSDQPLGRFDVSFRLASLQNTLSAYNVEARHPYLVQYNESFYSFISRVANRSGEPLFANDKGQLVLGILDKNVSINNTSPYTTVTIDVGNVNSISYPGSRYAPKPLATSFHYNYKDESFKNPTSSPLPDVEQCSNNELAETIVKLSYSFPSGPDITNTFISAILASIINNQFPDFLMHIFDLLSTVVTDVLPKTFASIAAATRNTILDANKANYDVRASFGSHYVDKEQEFQIPKSKGNGDNKTDPNENDLYYCASPFASPGFEVDDSFLSSIRSKALASAHSILRLSLKGTLDNKICLGSVVSYKDIDYLVIRIQSNFSAAQNNSTKSLSIDLLPADSTSNKFCPPLYPCASRPPASPQPAFVTNNSDPSLVSNLARVRIRYPWQPDDDVASPWIRISNIFASTTGSSAFIPNVGDEVMIDYEFGNIERPFVAGALFNASHTQPPFDRCIYSDSGQYIAFRSTPPFHTSSLFSSLVPGYNLVTRFLPSSVNKLASPTKNSTYNQLSGKLEMSDKFGFWNITGDTSKRLVSFSSIYGNISISAFSGITISAPRGDINFIAKNIYFQAANNIRIASGLGRKSAFETENCKKNPGTTVANKLLLEPLIKMVAKATDIGFIRSFFEMIITPKEGSLFLHSDAFMTFQAGKGQIVQNVDTFCFNKLNLKSKDPHDLRTLINKKLISLDVFDAILYLVIHYVNSQIDNCVKYFNQAYYKVNSFRLKLQSDQHLSKIEKMSFFNIKETHGLEDFYEKNIGLSDDNINDIEDLFQDVKVSCLKFKNADSNLFKVRPNYMNDKLWDFISAFVHQSDLTSNFALFNLVDIAEDGIKDRFDMAYSPDNKKWALRRACLKVYSSINAIDDQLLSLQMNEGDEAEPTVPNFDELNDDQIWNNFVDHISFNPPASSTADDVKNLFKKVADNACLKQWPVFDASNAEISLSKAHLSNGQILFSDRHGVTSFFSAGELQTTSIGFNKILRNLK